jgi:hypothetical protein
LDFAGSVVLMSVLNNKNVKSVEMYVVKINMT